MEGEEEEAGARGGGEEHMSFGVPRGATGVSLCVGFIY